MIDKLPFLPDEHHYAIAHVAARSSQMEHLLEHLVSAVLQDQKETAKYLLKNLSADRIVGLLQAALLDNFPQDADTITKLTTEIGRVRTERNNLFHWIWGKSVDPTKAVQASIRPFREDQMKERTAEGIKKIADDLMTVGKALVHWSDLVHEHHQQRLREKLKPLLDRPAQLIRPPDSASPSGLSLLDMPPPSGLPQEPSQE